MLTLQPESTLHHARGRHTPAICMIGEAFCEQTNTGGQQEHSTSLVFADCCSKGDVVVGIIGKGEKW